MTTNAWIYTTVVVDATRSQIKPHDYQKANQFYNHHFYKKQIGCCKKRSKINKKTFSFSILTRSKWGHTVVLKVDFWRENSKIFTFSEIWYARNLCFIEKWNFESRQQWLEKDVSNSAYPICNSIEDLMMFTSCVFFISEENWSFYCPVFPYRTKTKTT